MTISENDLKFIAGTVKVINNKVRKYLGQEESKQEVPTVAVQESLDSDFNPEESWKRWKKSKLETGWTLCAPDEYDQEQKKHPNLVEEYKDLPESEKVKDYVFFAICEASERAINRERDRETQSAPLPPEAPNVAGEKVTLTASDIGTIKLNEDGTEEIT